MIAIAGAGAGAGALALSLAACSSSGSTDSANAPKSFSFLAINENTTIPSVLTELSTNECKAENKALPLKITKQAQASLDQQLALLAGQKALPVAFVSPGAPALTKKLYKSGDIVNFDKTAKTAAADIVPAADSSVKALYNGDTIVLPTELNIEGIWYNKAILKKNGIPVPTDWSSLVSAFNTLKAAGVQPISNAGKGGDGWGVTRWVGAYIFRDLGGDAMTKIASGSAKLTDPDYVKAANAIGALGKVGDFGPSPQSVDYATALNTFLTGGAGFIYMGSWAVSNFNDPAADKIGSTNIGFLPYPSVAGGKGAADQTPANVGTTISVSASAYKSSTKVQNWVNRRFRSVRRCGPTTGTHGGGLSPGQRGGHHLPERARRAKGAGPCPSPRTAGADHCANPRRSRPGKTAPSRCDRSGARSDRRLADAGQPCAGLGGCTNAPGDSGGSGPTRRALQPATRLFSRG